MSMKNMENNERKEDIPTVKTCTPKLSMSKMVFITNAIENGWNVKKRNGYYIFSKKHENKKEVYSKTYLDKFIHSNLA